MYSASVVPLSTPSAFPPCNIDAEIAVLGGLMFDPHAYARIEDRLHPELFSLETHKSLCKAIVFLKAKGKSSDLLNVVSRLSDEGALDRVGGKAAVFRIFDLCLTAANIDQHVDLLIDKFIRRKTLEVSQQVKVLAHSANDIETGLDAIAESIAQLSALRASDDVESCVSILERVFPEIEQRQENPGACLGVRTGLYDLDAMTQGLPSGAMVTLAARPAMGKSSLAVQFAQHVAQDVPVVVFSLEMSKSDLTYRILSGEAGVALSRVRSGWMSPSEMEALTLAAAQIPENLYISHKSNVSISEINAVARSVKIRNGNRLGLVVIDYLQLINGSGENRNQEISKISRQVKIMARSLDVPVLVLSQLSRSVESRQNKRPILSDLRDSGAIEQDSDIVLLLYRDDYYNPDSPERGVAEVTVAKNRNGPTGTIKTLFESHLTRFRNLAGRDHHD